MKYKVVIFPLGTPPEITSETVIEKANSREEAERFAISGGLRSGYGVLSSELIIEKCPYCGSENVEWMGDDDCYNEYHWHCHECDCWFNEEVCVHEDLRNEVSAMLMDTAEDKPIDLDGNNLSFPLGENDNENVGLSSLNLPWVTAVFNDSEARPWAIVDGFDEPIEVDTFDNYDLEILYNALVDYYNI